ncbi:hypothetical protein C1645_840308 [Glomus cerebriforme]|uniref:Uncharacterized protein n=1 Tax=Glomus cerebriforme TaxID=658196 RepID=A0A397S0Z6_9GLOM|nr:hypothetical protein C1645_840308 [Glomus cerebriforme]
MENTENQIPSTDILNSNEEIRWALKENQKFGKKGGGKRITENLDKSDRYSTQEMWNELTKLVEKDSLEENDILKVSTIQNWIARYAAQHKQNMAQRVRQFVNHRNE